MKNIICFFTIFFMLQNTALASAYEDYMEMQAREALREKFYTCVMVAKCHVSGYLTVAGVNSCNELGTAKCQKLKQDYETMIKKCEAAYGKYK